MKNYIKSIQGKDKNMSLDMKNKRNLAILFVLMLPFSWVNFSFGSVYRIITFAIFALIGMPVSVLMSRKLMNRMVNNNKRSAALNAEMSGFNQESLSLIHI